jgi:hypothetical protein
VKVALLLLVGLGLWVLDVQGMYIVFLCIGAAILYGVVHDQVTARLCVEYFTIGHPPVFATHNPTLLGIGWGFLATWWVGLVLGVALALAARAGRRPKRSVASLVRPVALLLAVMAVGAAGAGVLGWLLADNGTVFLVGLLAERVPADRHVPVLAAMWAHTASYLFGFVGGVVVIVRVWRSRKRLPLLATGTDGRS